MMCKWKIRSRVLNVQNAFFSFRLPFFQIFYSMTRPKRRLFLAVFAFVFSKRRRCLRLFEMSSSPLSPSKRLCRLQNAVFSLPLSPFLPSKRRLFLRLRSVRWRVLDVGDAGLWDVLAEMRFYVDRDKVKKD